MSTCARTLLRVQAYSPRDPLIWADTQIRLSPFYDLSSQLPYPELIDQRVAMKIGDEYEIPLIGFSEWQALATGCASWPMCCLLLSRKLTVKRSLRGSLAKIIA
jgi:hypothetical protein